MATQKRIIAYQEDDATSFAVWTDLSDAQLKSIEGVYTVGAPYLDGRRYIYFDPRYDAEDIQCEITALAAQHNDDVLGQFIQHPRDPSLEVG